MDKSGIDRNSRNTWHFQRPIEAAGTGRSPAAVDGQGNESVLYSPSPAFNSQPREVVRAGPFLHGPFSDLSLGPL